MINAGSFTAAAERLAMSPQLVSKYVAQLEARLGVRLINRSTRRLSVTEAGQAYFERASQLLADFDDIENAVGDLTTTARGVLRINAPMSFGVAHLTPALARYRIEQPEVEIELDLNDRVVDVIAEGYDVVIRIGRLSASNLVARRLATATFVVCASPRYLSTNGVPELPEDLQDHHCLHYTYWSGGDIWSFRKADSQHNIRIRSANNGDALRLAALNDIGIVIQHRFIVHEELRDGRLLPVLDEFEIEPLEVYAVYAHRQYLSAKVRTLVDFFVREFGDPPYWEVK